MISNNFLQVPVLAVIIGNSYVDIFLLGSWPLVKQGLLQLKLDEFAIGFSEVDILNDFFTPKRRDYLVRVVLGNLRVVVDKGAFVRLCYVHADEVNIPIVDQGVCVGVCCCWAVDQAGVLATIPASFLVLSGEEIRTIAANVSWVKWIGLAREDGVTNNEMLASWSHKHW